MLTTGITNMWCVLSCVLDCACKKYVAGNWGGGGGGERERERTMNMPISTEGSGMPTARPETGFLV